MSKVIVVTGASRGIGAAIALELASSGFTVACLTRSGAGPDRRSSRYRRGALHKVKCDVTDEADAKRALAQAAAGNGLFGLVNNAGIHLDAPSHEMPTATHEEVMTTNATAVFTTCREAFPHFVKSGGGIIINIGSFFDRIGVKRNLAYCASKAAVGAITRCLAVEWAGKGIRVVNVAPGYIETDLNREAMRAGPLGDYFARRIPGGKPGTVSDVARLVAAVFCEDIPFLTGETIYLDGGQGIAH